KGGFEGGEQQNDAGAWPGELDLGDQPVESGKIEAASQRFALRFSRGDLLTKWLGADLGHRHDAREFRVLPAHDAPAARGDGKSGGSPNSSLPARRSMIGCSPNRASSRRRYWAACATAQRSPLTVPSRLWGKP